MKKINILILFCFIGIQANTQVILKQIGNFQIGEKLIYAGTSLDSLIVGNSGANITWDFSRLPKSKSIDLQSIKTTDGNKYQSFFKNANMFSDNGDSSCVFMEIKGDTNNVYGYVDEKRGMVVEYTKPYISIIRPLKYKDSIYCLSERKYQSYGYDYVGKGYSFYVVDGYGKLITPNGTYNNVLRVKSVQDYTDVMTSGYGDMKMKMITYAWYDDLHKDAICKVNYMEIVSPYFNAEYITIHYLQNDL